MKRAAALLAAFLLPLALAAAEAQAQPGPPGKAGPPSFQALDTNRDGRLTLDEVLAYAKRKSAEVQPFRIRDADLDGDGRITVEEQRKAGIKGLERFGAVDLKELDVRGDGYVSREALDEYFRRRHREAHARADADHDGALTPGEFALFRF